MIVGILLVIAYIALTFIMKPSNLLFFLFLVGAVAFAIGAITERIALQDVQENGVTITATVTHCDVVETEDSRDYNYHFAYEYNGKTYMYVDHHDTRDATVGESVTAYLYPDKPEELIFDDCISFFWSIFLFGMGLMTRWAIRSNNEEVPEVW